MRIRRDSLFVSSVLFTIALVCLIPAFWANVLTPHDKIWLAKLDAGYRAAAGTMSDLSVAFYCSMGLGISAPGITAARGGAQRQDYANVPRVALQRNLSAWISSNLGGVGSDFLVDGDRATPADKSILLCQGNTRTESWAINKVHPFLRLRCSIHYDCTIRLDTPWRPL